MTRSGILVPLGSSNPVTRTKKREPHEGSRFLPVTGFESCPHMPGELRAYAAGGRKSKLAISAAVGECKDQRKPAAFSGHRKADCA